MWPTLSWLACAGVSSQEDTAGNVRKYNPPVPRSLRQFHEAWDFDNLDFVTHLLPEPDLSVFPSPGR